MAGATTRWGRRRVLAWLAIAAAGVGLVAALRAPRRGPEGRDVAYGEAGGRALRLDLYRPPRPARPGGRPAVFLIHGGGWVQGNKASLRDLGEGLAGVGFVAVAVGYRLAGDDASRHPAQVDDVRRAVRWVRAHAAELGVDPDRLGAFGNSAGGHLAAILGTTDAKGTGDPPLRDISSRVNCVVDCCGPVDFTDDASPPLGPDSAWMVPNLFGKTRAEAPDAYRDASPLLHVDAHAAPTLIIHGTADDVVPLDQSRRFRAALARAGVEVKLVEIEGEGHSFAHPDSADRMILEAMAFLRRHLKP